MIKASIIGATGYTGVELVRLLLGHENVEIKTLTSNSYKGLEFTEVYPSFTGYINKKCEELNIEKIVEESDVIFVALPHGHSASIVKEVSKRGKKIIDLGADFRLNDVEEYEQWYNTEHSQAELLKEAIYGLPEINRNQIKEASIIANPGCYPTSVILGLMPALQKDLIHTNTIIVDSKTGVSGAGRTLALGSHYSEVNDSFKAYGVASHRHTPEMEQELRKFSGDKGFNISFTPHLSPQTRGILSTIYANLKTDIDENEIREIYKDAYKDENFVHLLPQGQFPNTKWVYGSNNCQINIAIDKRTNRLIIISAIDNLIKGASGQAVQNMNILFGLPETRGLKISGMYP